MKAHTKFWNEIGHPVPQAGPDAPTIHVIFVDAYQGRFPNLAHPVEPKKVIGDRAHLHYKLVMKPEEIVDALVKTKTRHPKNLSLIHLNKDFTDQQISDLQEVITTRQLNDNVVLASPHATIRTDHTTVKTVSYDDLKKAHGLNYDDICASPRAPQSPALAKRMTGVLFSLLGL